jgi:hypothetical protein
MSRTANYQSSYPDVPTAVERSLDLSHASVSVEELAKLRREFDALPYPSFKMSSTDRVELRQLLPQIDIELVEDCEVKPFGGKCGCGRQMSLLDVVLESLKTGKHSMRFIEEILSGKRGRFVIVGYQSKSGIPEDLQAKLPANTVYVKDVAPIPCKDCGRQQEAVLIQNNLLHYWIQ